MAQKNYMTPAGFQRLKDEYHELLHKERPKVVETVAWAASNGDRSENADYLYGKKRLREIDRRLKFLTDRLDAAEVVDPTKVQSNRVVFGATVTIRDEEDQLKTYQIVGEDEIDPRTGRISWKSPMSKALLGKQMGEAVLVQKPNGPEEIVIEKIEFK
ncbi:MAG: transcription elongation factor GreB [Bdellovibrionales bacterium]